MKYATQSKFFWSFALMFLVATTGVVAECSAEQESHHTVAIISSCGGLSDRDAALTLAINAVASYKFEFLPQVSLVPEFEVEAYLSGGEGELLWRGDADAARVLSGRIRADVIIVGRHVMNGNKKVASEFRVFYLPLDETLRVAKFEASNAFTDIAAFQRDVVNGLVEKLPFDLPAGFWRQRSVTSSKEAFLLFGEGIRLIGKDHVEAGLDALSRADKEDSEFRDLKYFLGVFFAVRQFSYERSTSYLRDIIEENPEDPGSHYRLGFVYRLMGEYNAATAEFERVKALKPGFIEAYIYLAVLYADVGEFDKVVENYVAALEIAPYLAPTWYSLASVQARMGDAPGALKSLRRAFELDSGTFLRMARRDSDFASLRGQSAFEDLLDEYNK